MKTTKNNQPVQHLSRLLSSEKITNQQLNELKNHLISSKKCEQYFPQLATAYITLKNGLNYSLKGNILINREENIFTPITSEGDLELISKKNDKSDIKFKKNQNVNCYKVTIEGVKVSLTQEDILKEFDSQIQKVPSDFDYILVELKDNPGKPKEEIEIKYDLSEGESDSGEDISSLSCCSLEENEVDSEKAMSEGTINLKTEEKKKIFHSMIEPGGKNEDFFVKGNEKLTKSDIHGGNCDEKKLIKMPNRERVLDIMSGMRLNLLTKSHIPSKLSIFAKYKERSSMKFTSVLDTEKKEKDILLLEESTPFVMTTGDLTLTKIKGKRKNKDSFIIKTPQINRKKFSISKKRTQSSKIMRKTTKGPHKILFKPKKVIINFNKILTSSTNSFNKSPKLLPIKSTQPKLKKIRRRVKSLSHSSKLNIFFSKKKTHNDRKISVRSDDMRIMSIGDSLKVIKSKTNSTGFRENGSINGEIFSDKESLGTPKGFYFRKMKMGNTAHKALKKY